MAESADDVMDTPQRMKLKRIVRDGPFSIDVEPGVQMATEP